jgi:hypothetical protein
MSFLVPNLYSFCVFEFINPRDYMKCLLSGDEVIPNVFILKILLLDDIIRCLWSGDAVFTGVVWKSNQPPLHQGVQVGSSKYKSRSTGRFKQF